MNAGGDRLWCVYTFFNLSGQPLYVGKTDDPKRRFKEHRKEKQWYPAVARKKIDPVDTEDEALALERKMIQELEPIHNVVHNGPPKKAPRPSSERPSPIRMKLKFRDLQNHGESELADVMARVRRSFIEGDWEEPVSKNMVDRFETAEALVRTAGLAPEAVLEGSKS